MPIYEFYCSDCHRVFHFLSRRVDTSRRPSCPRCGRPELERKVSVFAVSRGRRESDDEGLPEGLDEGRLERAMESLGSELDGLDEEDPRQAARLVRRLYESAGLPLGGTLEEALRRMEAGEDPDSVEADLGDALDEEPLGEPPKSQARGRVRRLLPPVVDPELYEL
jgi:putative FmdB family regulatory protein